MALTSNGASGAKSQCGKNGGGNYRGCNDGSYARNDRNQGNLVGIVSSGKGRKLTREFAVYHLEKLLCSVRCGKVFVFQIMQDKPVTLR